MTYRTHIELSKKAFNHNVDQIKNVIGDTALSIVVKSNAYGHGMAAISTMAQQNDKIEWICTAGLNEALSLRKIGIKKPIIVLSYLDGSYQEAIINNIHCSISTYEDALKLSSAAQEIGKTAYIHLKIDTGMSRLGIKCESAISLIQAIQRLPLINIYGIFTHLCDTPNPDQSFSYQQLNKFDQLLDSLEKTNIHIPCIHAQSSSSLCVKPNRKYNLIRAGAAIYGIWKSAEHRQLILNGHPKFDILPVMTWKTKIIQIKEIQAGDYVGYDRTYKAHSRRILAITPIGYWDGYTRKLSNKGTAIINGQIAPVVGVISMNLSTFDITDIKNVAIGDDVILVSNSHPITALDCAKAAGIITNEMVTQINSEIQRSVIEDEIQLISPKKSEDIIIGQL